MSTPTDTTNTISYRKIFYPRESGAWGVLLETLLLALLIACTTSALIAAAAVLALFFLRQPIRLIAMQALADRPAQDARRLRLAILVTALPATLCLALVAWREGPIPLLPLLAFALFGGAQLLADLQRHGRNLLPQLMGALGMTAGAVIIILAAGRAWSPALIVWGLLILRHWLTIALVRAIIRYQKNRADYLREVVSLHITVALAATLFAVMRPAWWIIAAVLSLLALRAIWHVFRRHRPIRAAILGVSELIIGLVYIILLGLYLPI